MRGIKKFIFVILGTALLVGLTTLAGYLLTKYPLAALITGVIIGMLIVLIPTILDVLFEETP